MNNYFYISYNKELSDSIRLVDIIKKEKWINRNTIMVNCSPDYSSRLTQFLNHKLSYLNGNELYEQIDLHMPYPTMNQIYNPEMHCYQLFDKYLTDWIRSHIDKEFRYLFVDSGTLRGKNFTKVRNMVKTIIEPPSIRFASLYLQSSSIFKPDYFVEEFDKNKQGGLLFEWENANNPNWDY